MNQKELTDFLLKARTKTYAGDGGKVEPAFRGPTQLEYKEGDWFYRDIYYTGNGIFMGMDIVYFQDKAVWGSSYYGNFKKMTEEEIDAILRQALLEKWETARTWQKVEWQKGDFKYICEPAPGGSIEEMSGTEKIFKNDEEVYYFYYAGGSLEK